MVEGVTTLPSQLNWLSILLIMSISGMFGGILDVLGIIDIRKLVIPEQKQLEPVIASGKRFVAALVLGGIGGIGGSYSMMFVIVAAAKLDTADTPINKLLLCSLGVVSGFLGFRVLRGVARGVERQIQESEARQEARTEEKIRMTEDRVEHKLRKVDYYDALNRGLEVAEKETLPSVQFQAISRLEEMRELAPQSREVVIVLGRVYRKLGRYQEAIDVLTELLNRIRNSNRNNDVADLLFNRACYYNLVADKLSDGDQNKKELKENVYKDLSESIRLSYENKKDAAVDLDFQTLWNEERFKRLIA